MKSNTVYKNKFSQIYILLIVIQLININPAFATKEPRFKVSDIPKELTKGANAVVRYNDVVYERKTSSDAVYFEAGAITILTKKGLRYSKFKEYYGKFSDVRRIRLKVYDANGNLVKKKGYDDIMDISAIDGGTLYSDARVKVIDPEYQTLPITVEYSYEVVYSGTLGTPRWFFHPGYNVAVEESSFMVITQGQIPLRFLAQNTDIVPEKTIENDKVTYFWQIENQPAVKPEAFSPSFEKVMPVVYSAPSYFKIDKYPGNASEWESFGQWVNKLNDGRKDLPEETIVEIRSMLNDSLNELETIRMLYSWMQDKTRYVSIQIGIGGWQPISAKQVDNCSYGDCKALSNYMHSILSVANIDSYYVLVRAGSNAPKLNIEFPSQQFNHAILCVPIENDTIWLECTSQTVPCGFIGGFTDDRDVLLISDRGGEIVTTKTYGKSDNYSSTNTIVKLNKYGDGEANIKSTASGLYYNKRRSVVYSTIKNRKEFIINNIDIPSFELVNFSFDETKSLVPKIEEEINLTLKSYATKLGKRLLFEVNLLNKHDYKFKRSGKRKNNILIRREFKETDTVVYNLPKNYIIESLPKGTEINSEFGNYSTQIDVDSSQITYIRNFEMNKGSYPNSRFADFKQFSTDIRKADNQKVVLINNGSD